MPTVLNLNTDALTKFADKLNGLSKTALPNVVRKTLNDAAMDVKKTTMPEEAKRNFTIRQKNFFTANSRVEFATGSNLNTMQSSVGFMEKNLKGQNNYSVKDLKQQEEGGSIGGRSFIPTKFARVANSNYLGVRKHFRLTEIMDRVVNASDFAGKNDRQKFIHAASHVGKGGYVIGTGIDNNFLYYIAWIGRVDKRHSLSKRGLGAGVRNRKGNTAVNAIPIYSVKASRSVNVRATNFMENASDTTTRKIERMFKTNAEARFNRDLKV